MSLTSEVEHVCAIASVAVVRARARAAATRCLCAHKRRGCVRTQGATLGDRVMR